MGVFRTRGRDKKTTGILIGLTFIAVVVLVAREQGEPTVLAGQASVIDGDTLRVAGQKVRLQGLAAPELSEARGHEAMAVLIRIVKGHKVSCELDGTTSHDRVVGICYVEGKDVAAELVKRGLARDCERFSGGRYKELETLSAWLLPLPSYCSP
jgi:endonuclease YncB( thermonuclease family)